MRWWGSEMGGVLNRRTSTSWTRGEGIASTLHSLPLSQSSKAGKQGWVVQRPGHKVLGDCYRRRVGGGEDDMPSG
eukprot:293985-Hanusia_phi.AAC.6